MSKRRRLRLILAAGMVGVAICIVLAVSLGIQNYRLQSRVETLDKLVVSREEADPLMAWECEEAEQTGGPCVTKFSRLLASPHLFHNQKIRTTALYLSGFEMAAFFDPYYRQPGALDLGKGIWFESLHREAKWPEDLDGRVVVIEGNFINRSSGHLSQYFGRLEDIELQTVFER